MFSPRVHNTQFRAISCIDHASSAGSAINIGEEGGMRSPGGAWKIAFEARNDADVH